MRTWLVIALALLSTQCARNASLRNEPRSVADHLESARHHEQVAIEHDRAARIARDSVFDPAEYTCGNMMLHEQSTSGTEPVTHWVPCWNRSAEATLAHREAARRARAAAQIDRLKAHALASAEREHCRGIAKDDLDQSPFTHHRVISEVVPHRPHQELAGVHIVLESVPGLTASYLRRMVACNQARFRALGSPPSFMAEDPTLVAGARVTVTERDGRFHVLVRTSDEVAAATALGRARELAPDRTAIR